MIFRKRAAPGHRNTPNGPSTAPSNPPGMSKPRVAIFGTTARSRVHCHAVNPSASCTRFSCHRSGHAHGVVLWKVCGLRLTVRTQGRTQKAYIYSSNCLTFQILGSAWT